MLKLVVGMVILKLILMFNYMVSQMLLHQPMIIAYIFDIITIIIATPYPLFFRNLKSQQLKHKLFPI